MMNHPAPCAHQGGTCEYRVPVSTLPSLPQALPPQLAAASSLQLGSFAMANGFPFQHCDTLAPIYTQANAVQPPFVESLVRAYPTENRPT